HEDQPYYHFDLEGRWQRAFIGETHYRKALDGNVDALDRVREDGNLVLRRRRLTVAETNGLDSAIREAVKALAAELAGGSLEWVPPLPDAGSLEREELDDLLARVIRWDSVAWFGHRQRHFETYVSLG